ncbi:DUF1206 domain-containing protein [Fictibacillus phosphorivorans]|uniref:DUF1206 domain-containing protein n=1 Tax=Fictibacillus phosphorivorans TaxID=1221500 RepID=UPI00203CD8DF|nr:DUF1206 domain-containing protein [Fictibacillus phosphorivorans]MCM3719283.1 DUF1206 domain-containing protein [Fictibacillus phosphorivorans]MCM3776905.1 DUF1206 domain-containing protein [Fictibacillus phosphorivorans]
MTEKQPFVKKETKMDKIRNLFESFRPWIHRFAKIGYLSKGIVYVVIGVLALITSTGNRFYEASSQGALYTIAKQPFGPALLIVLALGLSAFAFWQVIKAIFDPECVHHSWKRWFNRIGFLFIAGVYTAMCISALRILFRARSESSDEKYQTLSAQMLEQPFGQILIAIAGLVFGITGFTFMFRAISGRFKKELKKNEMNKEEWKWSGYIGMFGIAARGIVFMIIAFFLIRTAIYVNPEETKGLDGALLELSNQPFGPILLAIVALGFIAYGVFMFANAKYHRLNNE